jgi:hypothetical protein
VTETERPLCKCHGEAMRWAGDRRKAAGGYWQCAVKYREYQRTWQRAKYANDPVFRQKKQAAIAERYHNDPDFRARHNARGTARTMERYHNDPIFRIEWKMRNTRNARRHQAEARREQGLLNPDLGWVGSDLEQVLDRSRLGGLNVG